MTLWKRRSIEMYELHKLSVEWNRRDVLRHLAVCGTALGLPPMWSAVAHADQSNRDKISLSDRRLVVVELTGGNDGLNTIIPFEDPEYHKSRPTLAIKSDQVLKMNDSLGFHSGLAGLRDLWEAGHVQVIENVGYPKPNRSHFRSMDIWHSAQMKIGPTTGWLGGIADKHAAWTSCHVGGGSLPLAVRRRKSSTPSVERLSDYQSAVPEPSIIDTESTDALIAQIEERQRSARHLAQTLSQVKKDLPTARSGSLDERLTTVLGLLRAGLPQRIYYTSLSGFDTHGTQEFAHAGLLRQLGQGLKTFVERLKKDGLSNQVTILVFSEFGRRVRENGTRGTDHGAAAPMFLIGDPVNGGLTGQAPDLQNLERGDIKFKIDFRQVYAAILRDWLSTDANLIVRGFKPVDGLFKA